jgi:hypothetical protein
VAASRRLCVVRATVFLPELVYKIRQCVPGGPSSKPIRCGSRRGAGRSASGDRLRAYEGRRCREPVRLQCSVTSASRLRKLLTDPLRLSARDPHVLARALQTISGMLDLLRDGFESRPRGIVSSRQSDGPGDWLSLPRESLSLRRSSCGCRVALRTALRVRGDPPRSPGRAGAPHSLRRPAEP